MATDPSSVKFPANVLAIALKRQSYGVKAIDGINLRVRRGECVGLCGENGAGKSTMMKVLSAVYPYGTWSGQIIWKARNSRRRPFARQKKPASSSSIRN